eukprot:4753795-Pleurochrysis_carterae.AAC.1
MSLPASISNFLPHTASWHTQFDRRPVSRTARSRRRRRARPRRFAGSAQHSACGSSRRSRRSTISRLSSS